jgi:hypothetical protein
MHRKLMFKAALFESPSLKSWNEGVAPNLRRALVGALDGIQAGKPIILDLLVELEAAVLEPKVEASSVVLWRARPSQSMGARIRRKLGFYSGESSLAAAIELRTSDQVNDFLVDTALWDAEFCLYSPTTRPLTELPDPHYDVANFAGHTRWSLNQDAGNESWLLTSVDDATLEMVTTNLRRAFSAEGLDSHLRAAPPAVFAAELR